MIHIIGVFSFLDKGFIHVVVDNDINSFNGVFIKVHLERSNIILQNFDKGFYLFMGNLYVLTFIFIVDDFFFFILFLRFFDSSGDR